MNGESYIAYRGINRMRAEDVNNCDRSDLRFGYRKKITMQIYQEPIPSFLVRNDIPDIVLGPL